jgi:hypothetical protein
VGEEAVAAALPGVPEGQVEPGPLVERAAALGPAPGRAPAAVGRQPELAAQGHQVAAPRPELVAGPALPG